MRVEVEEVVGQCKPPDNGAGPFWCYGAPLLVRRGRWVYLSAMETGEGVPKLCNTRPRVFARRDSESWRLAWQPEGFREREPCPLVGVGSDILLSVNPSTRPPSEQYAECDPHLLRFARSRFERPERSAPRWPDGAKFTEHSYRGIGVCAATGDLLLLHIDGATGTYHWALRNARGEWPVTGRLAFPIRSCYPQVLLRRGAAHVLAIGDIVEPVEEWRQWKRQQTGREWDYVFRKLYYAWTPDLRRQPFSAPILLDDVDATAGHITNLDLWASPSGAVQALYLRRTSTPIVRDRFLPGVVIRETLRHAILRDGKLERTADLIEAGEGLTGPTPWYARYHSTDGRRAMIVASQAGTNGPENVLIETDPEIVRVRRIPLEKPLWSFHTATERGGSSPSDTLDLFGPAADGVSLRYAKVTRLKD